MKTNSSKENNQEIQYNGLKNFQDTKSTKIFGKSHTWQGDWKDKKKTLDLWEFNDHVNKNQGGKVSEKRLDIEKNTKTMQGYTNNTSNTNYTEQRRRLMNLFQSTIYQT